MPAIDEQTITSVALDQMSGTPNPRLREIMECLVRHLHAFAREADLTPEEWLEGIKFLTAVGQTCTPYRQEFILLSDTLGLSSLINTLHDRRSVEVGTKTSLLGPFYRQGAPTKRLGESIASPDDGSEICIYGRVTDISGKPIPNASIEIWQSDDHGFYDLQKHDPSEMDLRGCFFADCEANYYLRTVRPLGYLIPLDGPVGDLIRAQRRHGYRPAHIHFLVGAPHYRELVTALYLRNDDHIHSDTVFGVTDSLITETVENDPDSPFPNLPSIHFDFRLGAAAAREESGRVGADPAQIVKRRALISH
jgi:hydroxyquinol 1,2-dioxygenase